MTALAERGLKVATMQRRLSTISQAHQLAEHDSRTRSSAVRLVWAGVRRAKGVAQEGKAPTLTEDIRAMVQTMAPRRGQARGRNTFAIGRCSWSASQGRSAAASW